MFYELKAKSHVRVPPHLLDKDINEAILTQLNSDFEGYISQETGFVINVTQILNIGEGIIIPGDGAAYYDTEFNMLTYMPELQEVALGQITDITNYGAFINIGPVDGLIHLSQTMDDFVSFAKTKVLSGKESKKILKVNDKCRARVIAVSYKDISNPKIALTMRQPMMGNLQWLEEAKKAVKKKK